MKTAKDKSEKFAIRIIKLCRYLNDKKKELLSKLYISLKECVETKYWLNLLYETEFIKEVEYKSLLADCEEIRKMLSASTKTVRPQIVETK